jgi:hypothetical protein
MGLSEQLHSFTKTQFPKEHRMVMRLWRFSWRHSRIISIIALVVLTLPGLAVGFIVGKSISTTNIYIPAAPSSANGNSAVAPSKWEPLSVQETTALHQAWRDFPSQHLGVFCAIPACADLAESIFNVATGLHWKASYQSTYMTDDAGIRPGLEIWSWPQAGQDVVRDKIANAIEHATNGRLLISSHEYSWKGDAPLPNAQVPPDFGLQINLIIGRLK